MPHNTYFFAVPINHFRGVTVISLYFKPHAFCYRNESVHRIRNALSERHSVERFALFAVEGYQRFKVAVKFVVIFHKKPRFYE